MFKQITLLLALASLFSGQMDLHGQQQQPDRAGILLLAHGGSAQSWNEEVRHVADRADLVMPTEIAFGMASRSAIQNAVDRLVARGVTKIVAVPLFISSHSSVVDSIAYLLGLRKDAPDDLKMFASMEHSEMMTPSLTQSTMADMKKQNEDATRPVISPVPIRMASALDHNQVVAKILQDRAASISLDPKHEILILVAHGPVAEEENQKWLRDMQVLAAELHQKTQYAEIEPLTLRDDAPEKIRNAATAQLRRSVEAATQAGRTALVVPLLLSYGGIEEGIRQRLTGLSYRMPDQGLLPDERIVNWVIETARSTAVDR